MRIITTHINADFDGLASMIAAKKIYEDALVVFSGSYEKKVKEFLLFYSSDLKINKIRDVDLDKITELIIVDTKSASRIGGFSEILNKKGLKVVIYDHHPLSETDIKGEIINKDLQVGATITLFLKEFEEKNVNITRTEAVLFAIALYEETGFFSFSSTTPLEFKMMAFLISAGADINRVRDFLKEGLSPEQELLFNKLVVSINTYEINNVPIKITEADANQYVKDIALVVHKIRDMGNLDCLFAIVKLPDRLHIVARNRLEEVDVNEIMKVFGGGGHKVAASATVKADSIDNIKNKLLKVLEEKVKPFLKASDIMSSPVLSIKPTVTCEEARKIMLRFNHSILPVAKDNYLQGIVSITDLDKAIQHNFNDASISGYMITDVKTAKPDTSVSDIQKLMIEENISKIPIVNDTNGITGIVTRTDILKSLKDKTGTEQYSIRTKERMLQIEKQLERAYPAVESAKDILAKRLPVSLYNMLVKIGSIAEENKVNLYIVGGFVRDTLLNIENYDIDLVVEGEGINFAKVLSKKFDAEIKIHKKFGTAILTFKNGFKIDVATSRVEFYEYPASAPRVEFSLIKYDLYRRDFTINTMAIKLNSSEFGMLIDFFGGQKDLQNKVIRVLHNMSFVEDPTRIFRAIRFEQRYGFKIENNTRNFLMNALELEMFDKLATYKMKEELILILNEDLPLKAINRMKELDVLKYIHPDIKITRNIKNIFKEVTNSFAVEILFLEKKVDRWLVNFLALVDDLNLEDVKKICFRFKFDKAVTHKIILIKEAEKKILNYLDKTKLKNSLIYKEIVNIPLEGLLFYLAKSRSLRVRQRIHLYLSNLMKMKVELNGDDLKNLGIKPGPIYKDIFRDILYNKLDGLIKTKNDELTYVKNLKL